MQAATKKFRPYQAEASEAILKNWKQFQSCITVVATGGGKTLIAAGTAAKVKDHGRILFLANRNELCEQPLGVFREQCGVTPGLEKAESRVSLDDRIVIGSVQTLCRAKRLERFPQDHFQYIFADECHGAVAESWKRIFAHFPNAKLCGITATPFRADNKKLTDIFQTEAYRKGLFDLVDQGYLVSPDHVDKLKTAISLANVRVKKTVEGVDYDMQEAADAIEPYFQEIAKELVERHSDKHILAFLPLVYSSQKFVAACRAAGLNAVHVDGEDPERDEKLEAFKAGQITLLSNSNLLHTGVDMPICNALLPLRPTRSKIMYQQMVGRTTRTVPGLIDGIEDTQERLQAIAGSAKPVSTIIDPLWLSNDHDLVTPSFLIAENQEEAEEMNQLAGTTSYSLRGLNRKVIEEREAAILRRLRDVANFRDGKLPAEYFAAAIKDHALSRYEPVFDWEYFRPGRFTLRLLESAGIDPTTVATEGQARQIMRAVYRRRYRGLAEIRDLAVAAERGLEDLWTLTKEQARRMQ